MMVSCGSKLLRLSVKNPIRLESGCEWWSGERSAVNEDQGGGGARLPRHWGWGIVFNIVPPKLTSCFDWSDMLDIVLLHDQVGSSPCRVRSSSNFLSFDIVFNNVPPKLTSFFNWSDMFEIVLLHDQVGSSPCRVRSWSEFWSFWIVFNNVISKLTSCFDWSNRLDTVLLHEQVVSSPCRVRSWSEWFRDCFQQCYVKTDIVLRLEW